jgi:hypothetical protein
LSQAGADTISSREYPAGAVDRDRSPQYVHSVDLVIEFTTVRQSSIGGAFQADDASSIPVGRWFISTVEY